jgi:type IV pilus assembly protein PilP
MLMVLMAISPGVRGLLAADAKVPPPAPAAGSVTSEAKPAPAPPTAAAKPAAAPVPGAAQPGTPQVPAGAKQDPAKVPEKTAVKDYRIVGKNDPFKPFMETDLAVKLKKEEELKKRVALKVGRPISPLQQSDIMKFRLVGIAGDRNRRTAVVEDAVAKKFYPLMVGTYIGQNDGRVSAILDDRVIVEERIEDPDGQQAKKAKIRRVTVMLHKEYEGKQ